MTYLSSKDLKIKYSLIFNHSNVFYHILRVMKGLNFWKFTYKYVLSSEHKAQKIGEERKGAKDSFLWSPG